LQRRTEERTIMKRVGEWAADSPEETVNLLELSKVAGVPLRQLQQAFKAYTGMTRATGCACAGLTVHTANYSIAGHETTVAEVAMNWSFWHLGRFSNSYRALFKSCRARR
jgi:transcriptional regulator GlxA family with amidase domain